MPKVDFDKNMQSLRDFMAVSGWTPDMLVNAVIILRLESKIFAGHDPVIDPVTGEYVPAVLTPKS